MIQINEEQATNFMKRELETLVEYADEPISINDEDELHDAILEGIDDEALYHALCGMLPVVFDELEMFVDEINDYEDEWGTYAMREGIGFCDF